LPTCSKQSRSIDCRWCGQQARPRRVLLTTRSTFRGEIFQVQRLGQSSRGKCPYFRKYPNFLVMCCGTESSHTEISLICSAVFTELRLVTDTETGRQTDIHAQGRALAIYTVSQKKQDTKLLPITSPNVNRFSKFFHWQTHW